MNSQSYEKYIRTPNPNPTVIDIYNLTKSGKLSNNQLIINLSENLDIHDDDVEKIIDVFKDAFQIMKDQGIIQCYKLVIDNRKAEFSFIC